MSADPCGTGACGDCTFACAGGAPGNAGASDDLAVVAAAGTVVAVLAGILALGAVPWVAILSAVTAVTGAVLAAAALVAHAHGDGISTARVAVGLLPYVTGGLLLTVLARAATSLLA